MKSSSSTWLLAGGLLLCPAFSLQASVDSFLKLELKCFSQGKTSSSDDSYKGKVETLRLDSKQLLDLLEKQLNVNYPAGSQLKVAVDGKVYVTDSDGVVLDNVSQQIHANLDDQNRLFDGKINTENRKQNSENYFPITLTIDLISLQGTVGGIAIEKINTGGTDKDGVQVTTGKTQANVNGQGRIDGGLGFYDGSLSLNGRKARIR